jgi:translation initiation factor IF-3
MSMQREAKTGPRINEEITSPNVFLIDAEGVSRGATATSEALAVAMQDGLDLVEINPNGDPPVVKILDYGKFKYQAQKKAAEAKKRQKVVEIKEIKLRPNIDTHDYEVKARAMRGFFEEGDKVKVTLRFRGRELAHTEIGVELLNKVQKDFEPIAKVESFPRMEGKQMVMVMSPR